MNKTKILLCGPSISALGGGPTHIRGLLSSKLGDRYDLIHFHTGSRGRESPATDEMALAKGLRLLFSPFAVAYAILHSGARIVHLNSVLDHKAFWRDCVYAFVSKVFGCKVVLQMHGGSLGDLCRYPIVESAVRRLLAMPDAVVLLASQEQKDFTKYRIAQRPFVIPNGIDIGPFREVATRVHSGCVRRLAYMGRLIRSKGIFEVIEAVECLRLEPYFRDLEFRIAGAGPAREEIEQTIRERHLSDFIKLDGPVYGSAKIRFLQQADIFVFPTYHQEGLPYTILESLAAGTPVIATRVAGIPDVIVDGVHGKLIESRDASNIAAAVRELAGCGPELRAMSQKCTVRVAEAFSLERLAERFEEVYEQLKATDRAADARSG